MWKKSEQDAPYQAPEPQPRAPERTSRSDQATIGPSITIKGDLTGDEDLMIQGHVNGEVRLPKNKVTIGQSGRVEADVYGKSIQVEGKVKGNLYGEVDVVVRASGVVQGNITGPRVTLENGANFKGSIDMEPVNKGAKPAPQAPTKTPETARVGSGAPGAELKTAPSGG